MEKELENLVRDAEKAIQSPGRDGHKKKKQSSIQLPKASIAAVIWLIIIVTAAFQFGTVVKIVTGPTEARIESDLGTVLSKAASTLRSYEINNGALPFVLPNPAIRGLVKYERQSDSLFRLEATISSVTMVMESSNLRPYREQP